MFVPTFVGNHPKAKNEGTFFVGTHPAVTSLHCYVTETSPAGFNH